MDTQQQQSASWQTRDGNNRLQISETTSLPLSLVTETVAILAKKGSGKTYSACVLTEEMVGAGAHVVALDPLGVWWSLRAGADGGQEGGLPLLILGGDHADLPLSATDGAAVADLVTGERLSCVLDVSRLPRRDTARFAEAFLRRLYETNREALHLMVDEADLFAPQQSTSREQQAVLEAMDEIVRRGRVRGLGATLITQRPAVLSKDVLNQIEMLVTLRMTAPLDQKAIDTWISAHGTNAERKAVISSLATLGIGEAWLWAPNILGDLRRVQFRRRRTFDGSATPKVGETVRAPKALAEINILALRERFAVQVEAASDHDPVRLRARIEELTKRLSAAPPVPAPVVVEKIVEKRVEVSVEVPVLREGELARLEALRDSIAEMAKEADAQARELTARLDRITSVHASSIAAATTVATAAATSPPVKTVALQEAPSKTSIGAQQQQGAERALPTGARRILEALSRYAEMRLTEAQLGTRAKLKMSAGAAVTYVNRLKAEGLLTKGSDGLYQITSAGLSYLGKDAPRRPQTTEELVALWTAALKNKETQMLRLLVDIHPEAVTLTDLATQMNMTASGGAFNGYIGTLRTNGLVEPVELQNGVRAVRAATSFFDFG